MLVDTFQDGTGGYERSGIFSAINDLMPHPPLEVIDYSSAFYVESGEHAIPLVRGGKFILIEHEGTFKLIVSPRSLSNFHANILKRYCDGVGVEVHFNKKEDEAHVHAGIDLEIHGGGFWQIDDSSSQLYLWGKSQAYGPFDASIVLSRGLALGHELILGVPSEIE